MRMLTRVASVGLPTGANFIIYLVWSLIPVLTVSQTCHP
jgi:hypothetical protein